MRSIDKAKKLINQWTRDGDGFHSVYGGTEDFIDELVSEGILVPPESLESPPEPLFGRWATHTKYGRGICTSARTFDNGLVWVSFLDDDVDDGVCPERVPVAELDFDPLILTTVEDFKSAPEGTIVDRENSSPVVRTEIGWGDQLGAYANDFLAEYGPWTVARWGRGEQV